MELKPVISKVAGFTELFFSYSILQNGFFYSGSAKKSYLGIVQQIIYILLDYFFKYFCKNLYDI